MIWILVGLFSNTKYLLFKQTKGRSIERESVCKKQGCLLLPLSIEDIEFSLPLIGLSLTFLSGFVGVASLSLSLSLSLSTFLERMEGVEEKHVESEKRRRFQRICVFCGSRSGNKSTFSDAALDLGKRMVERKINLVYGGGSVGLMGLISQTVFNGGCHVLGVIPKALLPHEISGGSIGEVKTVADMHERKSEMAKNADAFIALPGGYGTLEELLEMIAWSQLGIHEKPVGLLNVDGYYNNLLALFDKGVEEGFIKDSARHIVVSAETAEELITKMEAYAPVHDKVAPRQSWEVDQLLESSTSGPIPRC